MAQEAEPDSPDPTDVDGLLDLAEEAAHRDPDRCAELLDRAEARTTGYHDIPRSARISELRGALALCSGDLPGAAAAYRHARRHWLATGRRLQASRAALGCTAVQLAHGEYRDALAAVRRVQGDLAAGGFDDEPQVTALNALVHRQLADALAASGDTSAALRHYGVSENLYRALGDVGGVGTVSLGRGRAELDRGLAHRALAELTRARDQLRRSDRPRAVAVATVFVAEALSAAGEVARALELLDRVEPDLGKDVLHLALHGLTRAQALLRAGLPAEAHAEARATEQVFTDLGVMERSARAALLCGIASLRLGKHDAAAAELATADRIFLDCGNRIMGARTWLVQARWARAIGDDQSALGLCRRVLDAGLDQVAPRLGVEARLLQARAGAPDQATALLDETAELAAQTGVPELRMHVSLGRARHHRRAGRAGAAVEELRRTLSIGHSWQERPHGAPGSVRAVLAEAADELIEVLLERDDHAARLEAWQRAHLAKRSSVVPLAARAHGWVPDTSEEVRQRRLEELVTGSGGSTGSGPAFGTTARLPAVPASSFVEYYVTGDDVIAFVGRDGHVESRRLRGTAGETRRLVRAWQQECLLMAASQGALRGSGSSPALDGLYDLLLAPLSDLLADLDDDLAVHGHLRLHAVPFDALVDRLVPVAARPVAATAADTRPVAERVSPPAALVLAVPDENAPSIRAEAEMIFRTLPSAEILVAQEATRRRLAELAGTADIVHLACHAVFRRDNPLLSALRLGDGWLLARDIMDGTVRLDGAVVVLSACSSGLSADHVSEPLGLARACLEAGARGVVAALWSVDDAVTLQLMTRFYAGLAHGLGVTAALAGARREIAREHPHPYYWAAFRFLPADDPSGR